MIFIGIDPGKSGAIAIRTEDGKFRIYDIPTIEVVESITKSKIKTRAKSKTKTRAKKKRLYDLSGLKTIFAELGRTVRGKSVIVVCEYSMGMAFQATGVRGSYHDSAHTAYEKGRGFGILETFALIYDMPINATVRPNDWKRALKLTNPNLTYKEKKDVARLFAIERHPELEQHLKRKKDDGRAEAVLLVDWIKMRYEKDKVCQ